MYLSAWGIAVPDGADQVANHALGLACQWRVKADHVRPGQERRQVGQYDVRLDGGRVRIGVVRDDRHAEHGGQLSDATADASIADDP